MSQLVIKSPKLEYLKIDGILPPNGAAILEFAGLATTNSSCLHTLHIEDSTTAEDGDKFMKVLADDHINWLHHLTISAEGPWFGTFNEEDEGYWPEWERMNDRDECMDSLLILLARQTNLQTLTMEYNGLSAA